MVATSSVLLRTLARWTPAWLLLIGLLLVPAAVQAQVEIDGIVKDYSDLNPRDSGTATVTIQVVGASMVDAFLTLDVPTDAIELDEVTPSAGSCTQDGTDTPHVDCTFDDLASDSTREVDVIMTATDSLGGPRFSFRNASVKIFLIGEGLCLETCRGKATSQVLRSRLSRL